MKISVIIPTRNRTHFLKRCIKSVENQTEEPFELIVVIHVDDKITKEHISQLSSKIKIKYFETTGGSCKSRNLGINHVLGDIVVFIDDDEILEENYIKNLKKVFQNENVDIIAGYTFDNIDLTTPWLFRKGDIDFILKNKDDKFFKMIMQEISKCYPNYWDKFENNYQIIFYSLIKSLRDFFKIIVFQEGFTKGRILSSGYRSEMPVITKLRHLEKVEWFNGGNFAVKKDIINKFKFNEDIEILPYALGEDLELSARMGKNYNIFLSPDIYLFHLRSQTGVKINQRQRFKSIIIIFYHISSLRGNSLAYWWGAIGIIISRIVMIPFSYNKSISELKGIFEGIEYLRNMND